MKHRIFFDSELPTIIRNQFIKQRKLGIGLEPKSADFFIERTDFYPQLVQLTSVLEAQGSQKSLEIIEGFELWAVLDSNQKLYN
jgi:hypothetical protein